MADEDKHAKSKGKRDEEQHYILNLFYTSEIFCGSRNDNEMDFFCGGTRMRKEKKKSKIMHSENNNYNMGKLKEIVNAKSSENAKVINKKNTQRNRNR